MNYVLDPCVLALLRYDEKDPRHKAVADYLEKGDCYITPISVAEVYREIGKSKPQRADAQLEMFLSGQLVKVVDDRDSEPIKLAALTKRACGVSYAVCFPVALAKKLRIPVLAARVRIDPPGDMTDAIAFEESGINEFEIIEAKAFCEIKWVDVQINL